jgi:hypothetical protein
MPYKARLGSGEPRKRGKPQYRVANACEYNRSLKRRAPLSLFFPRGDLRAVYINSTPRVRGVAGRELQVHAVVHGKAEVGWHDQIVNYIEKKGMHAFRDKYAHSQRPLVELQISRVKRCIGARLLTRKIESQQLEGVTIANLLNLRNSFGRYVCAKNG